MSKSFTITYLFKHLPAWCLGIAINGLLPAFAGAEAGVLPNDIGPREYYQQNREQFDIVEAQHIAILRIDRQSGKPLPEAEIDRQEQRARKLLRMALAGECFDQLVQQSSEDLSSIESKGRFRFQRHTMMIPFDDWCFSAEVGDIGWVTTDHAFHIVRLNWRSEFSDVCAQVKQYLGSKRQ